MLLLDKSLCASGDEIFQRAQATAWYSYSKLLIKPELVSEFITFVSEKFTSVDDWTSENITLSTYRLYGKKFPSKEAAKQFIQRVRRSIRVNDFREKIPYDVDKSR